MTSPYSFVLTFVLTILPHFGNSRQIHPIHSIQQFEHLVANLPHAVNNPNVFDNAQYINDNGPYSPVCWSKIVTLVENSAGRILDEMTEYAITFEYPNVGTSRSLETGNKYEKVAKPTTENVRKVGNKIIREIKYESCSSGPWFKMVKYSSEDRVLEIRVSPKKHAFNVFPSIDDLNYMQYTPDDAPTNVQQIFDLIKTMGSQNNEQFNIDLIKQLVGDELLDNMDMICEEDIGDDGFNIENEILNYLGENRDPFNVLLPGTHLVQNLVRYIDDNGEEHCFVQLGNKLNPTHCPADTSMIPHVPLTDGNSRIQVKYVDPLTGLVQCYDFNGNDAVEISCPIDTSRLPYYNPYKDMVKFVDENGIEHCFYKSGNKLNPTNCPANTYNIPGVSLADVNNRISVKYVDPITGLAHCYDLIGNDAIEKSCPSDTSKLPYYNPYKNLVKYIDDNGVEHCFYKSGNELRPANCPANTYNIPGVSLANVNNRMSVKYVDPITGLVHCFDLMGDDVIEKSCPSDTSRLPYYNPYKNLVKYIDDNGDEHCFYKSGNELRPANCPANTYNIPGVSLADVNNRISVKYVDPITGLAHCYDLIGNDAIEKSCPSDTSKLPYYNPYKNLVKYIDDNGVEHCFYKSGNELRPANCPANTYNIPGVSLANVNNRMSVKYVDPITGLVHCFDLMGDDVIEKSCPSDTSRLPYYNPYKNLVKYIDDNGDEHCFYKSGNELRPANCPANTYNIPGVSLANVNNRISVKYIDPISGLAHCYDLIGNDAIEKSCPSDTSRLPYYNPYKNLVKYIDDNGDEHCFYKSGNELRPANCPANTYNIPGVSLANVNNRMSVKYIDPITGLAHCYDLIGNDAIEKSCPSDTSRLPYYNPYKNLVKYIDDNGVEHCFYKSGNELHPTNCRANTQNIPAVLLSDVNSRISVKYVDPITGLVRCFDLMGDDVIEKSCPSDTSRLPYYNPYKNLVKYIDDNGDEHCFYKSGNELRPANCPANTYNIPGVSLANVNNRMSVKYIDPITGLAHCYDLIGNDAIEKSCPSDTSRLPYYNPYKNLVKYIDDNGVEHCFYKSGNELHPTNCRANTHNIPAVLLSDVNSRISVKYVDPITGLVRCFDLMGDDVIEKSCPSDTSRLPYYNPYKNLVKYIDDNGDEHCFYKSGNELRPANCRANTHNIPAVLLSDVNNRISVKYVDPITGLAHCYDLIGNDAIEKSCPSDTSKLPYYNPYKNLVKYIDDNGDEHCFYKSGNELRPANCPANTYNIPGVSLANVNNRMSVKYVDPITGLAHCYDLIGNDAIEKSCPSETSRLPYYNPYKNLVKCIDDNGIEHCFYKSGNELHATNCPANTHNIPAVLLSDVNSRISVKYVDPITGLVHCFDLMGDDVIEKSCPSDTSRLPYYNPYKNLVKYIDDNGVEYCFYKSGNELRPANCPANTYNIPGVSLANVNNRISVKYVDPITGLAHCYDLIGNDAIEKSCPSDTSRLPYYNPYKNLVKYIDDNGVEHCFYKSGNELHPTNCPADTFNIPEVSSADGHSGITVKYVNPTTGQVHCYNLIGDEVYEKSCPMDTSRLPYYNLNKHPKPLIDLIDLKTIKDNIFPSRNQEIDLGFFSPQIIMNPNIVKLRDENNNIFCYDTSHVILHQVTCPENVMNLPDLNLNLINGQGYLAKSLDASGLHCFLVYSDHMEDHICPQDVSNLPFVSSKYPLAPIGLPVAPIHNLPFIEKIGNSVTGMKCVLVNGNVKTFIDCPLDTNILPQYNDDNNKLKPDIVLSNNDFKMLTKLVCRSRLLSSLQNRSQ